jgi:deoxyribonuclease IV
MFDSKKLNFGTAGIPKSTLINFPNSKNGTADGIKEVNNLNLDSLEIEFVRNIYLKNAKLQTLEEIRSNSISNNISLSIHAPYFINLNAKEKYKIENSINYVVDSLLVGQKIKSKIVLFHPGYFLKEERNNVLKIINNNIIKILDKFDKNKEDNSKIKLGLELTGKKTQVGSLEDILYFYDNLKSRNIVPVIDFAHVHARYNGYFKLNKNIDEFFSKLSSYPELLKNIHTHISGINYTIKGEVNHVMLEESDLPYRYIIQKLKELNSTGTIICESPNSSKDAILLKNLYNNI